MFAYLNAQGTDSLCGVLCAITLLKEYGNSSGHCKKGFSLLWPEKSDYVIYVFQ